jgi:oxygen-independent coproporphyrinogen-3 oxidase
MVYAIQKEIIDRKDFLDGEKLETVYLGGGTPSVLSSKQLGLLLDTVREHYDMENDPEITLEGNPDDLQMGYLEELRKLGINRLSVGIQSFHEEELYFMNRRHTKKQSHDCLEKAAQAGFDNMNIDLIYGIPGQTGKKWEENLDIATGYLPAHIAAYHLSYEKGTVLDYRRKTRRIKAAHENKSQEQFYTLIGRLQVKGYSHYEISNFALPGYISGHNSGYWLGKKYLGVGPSAHSFNGRIRRWNIAKNASYIKSIKKGLCYFDQEDLNEVSRFHEYLMTSLRTMWGADLQYVLARFGESFKAHCLLRAWPFLQSGRMKLEDQKLTLSQEGMFIADHIIGDLFLEQD